MYNVFIDAKAGIVKVFGEVDPNILLNAITRRIGRHAKLIWAKLDYPQMNRTNYYYGYGFSYRTFTLPECSWPGGSHHGYSYADHYTFRRRFVADDWPFYGRSSYFSGGVVPRSRYNVK